MVPPQAGPEMHPLHLALTAFLLQFARMKPKAQFNQWLREVYKRGLQTRGTGVASVFLSDSVIRVPKAF